MRKARAMVDRSEPECSRLRLLAPAAGVLTGLILIIGFFFRSYTSALMPVPDEITILNLETNDIIYDPVTERIYASVPAGAAAYANTVIKLDPSTGAVESSIPIGNDPNALALSDNGQYLYVGLDGESAVRRVEMVTLTADLQIPLDDPPPPSGNVTARDIEVLPGDPEAIAVARQDPGVIPSSGGVAIFDGEVMRPSTTPPNLRIDQIEFSESASLLYGQDASTSYEVLHTLAVDANGVSERESSPQVAGMSSLDMRFEDGTLYFAYGDALDAHSLTLLGKYPTVIAGSAYHGTIEVDSALGRVYYLVLGSSPTLMAFEQDTFRLTGSVEIGGVSKNVQRLVRWGTDGLAFNTRDGELVLVRPRLARADAPVLRLSASSLSFPDEALGGTSVSQTVLVSNEGLSPLNISGLSIGGRDPGDFTITADTCTGASLATGANCSIAIGFSPAAAGSRMAMVAIAHDGIGVPDEISLAGIGDTQPLAERVIQLRLAAEGIAYDPVSQLLYASVAGSAGSAGNSVVSINPATAAAGPSVYVGSDPGKIVLSDDGQFLYAALAGEAAVRRVDTNTLSPDLRFLLGRELWGPWYQRRGQQYRVDDMEALPGSAGSLAVMRGDAVAVYDDGVQRPQPLSSIQGMIAIEASDSPSMLYGSGSYFSRMTIDGSGVALLDETDYLLGGDYEDIEFDDGSIYSTSGRVVDPNALELLTTYPAEGVLEPDSSLGRVFFADWFFGTRIRAYDRTLTLLGTVVIEGTSTEPVDLVRVGDEGLALRTSTGDIFLIRTPLARMDGPAFYMSPAFIEFFNTLVGTESGPQTVKVTNEGISPMTVSSITFGGAAVSDFSVAAETCTAGPIAPGGSCTIDITFRPTATGPRSAHLNIAHDALGGTHQVGLVGAGTAPLVLEEPRVLSSPANDIVYDPVGDRVYASIPSESGNLSNSVARIDPMTGTIESNIPVGDDPGIMAVSDGGQYLYVVADGQSVVYRIALSTQTVDLQFSPGTVTDMEVLPGEPEALAVAMASSSGSDLATIAVFDSGVQRPETGSGGSEIEAGPPGTLFSNSTLALAVHAIGASGVSLTGYDFNSPIRGEGIEFEDGLIYATDGQAVDPENLGVVGDYLAPPLFDEYVAGVVPDPLVVRAFFLRANNFPPLRFREVTAFDLDTFAGGRSLDLNSLDSVRAPLIRWGADGLAFRTTDRRIVLVRTSVVPPPDTDRDGCNDEAEAGPDPALGGMRDPANFWDFFEVPAGEALRRDRAVSVGDISALVLRFGSTGDQGTDPLSTPPQFGYHTAFDRSAPAPGGDLWDLGPPDGAIDAGDILAAVNQFGHSCA